MFLGVFGSKILHWRKMTKDCATLWEVFSHGSSARPNGLHQPQGWLRFWNIRASENQKILAFNLTTGRYSKNFGDSEDACSQAPAAQKFLCSRPVKGEDRDLQPIRTQRSELKLKTLGVLISATEELWYMDWSQLVSVSSRAQQCKNAKIREISYPRKTARSQRRQMAVWDGTLDLVT